MSDGSASDVRPLFVLGMPRSGTKLLRAMLNQHPLIAIAEVETEFFPYWVASWPGYGDLSNYTKFERFFARFRSTPFYRYTLDKAIAVDPRVWHAACSGFSAAAVFEALIRLTVDFVPGQQKVWGDKSPSYLLHIDLLRRHFPAARFIHIVRDVRDYCLSINRAWGKNMLRAAQRWNDDVYQAHVTGASRPDDYVEVRYEDLLADPAGESVRICSFLELPFEPGMPELTSSEENLGDAKGHERILRSNARKYLNDLAPGKRLAIERIACRTMRIFEYECADDIAPGRLNPLHLALLKCADGINLFRASRKVRGPVDSLRFLARYSRITGKGHTARK